MNESNIYGVRNENKHMKLSLLFTDDVVVPLFIICHEYSIWKTKQIG